MRTRGMGLMGSVQLGCVFIASERTVLVEKRESKEGGRWDM